jgi:hypothetical protein
MKGNIVRRPEMFFATLRQEEEVKRLGKRLDALERQMDGDGETAT